MVSNYIYRVRHRETGAFWLKRGSRRKDGIEDARIFRSPGRAWMALHQSIYTKMEIQEWQVVEYQVTEKRVIPYSSGTASVPERVVK